MRQSVLIWCRGSEKNKKRKNEQASDVENLPVVEKLTLVGNLTVVEIFQGLRLLKRPHEEISSLFLCRGRQPPNCEIHLLLPNDLRSFTPTYYPQNSHLYNA